MACRFNGDRTWEPRENLVEIDELTGLEKPNALWEMYQKNSKTSLPFLEEMGLTNAKVPRNPKNQRLRVSLSTGKK